jgi:hypothetical protein
MSTIHGAAIAPLQNDVSFGNHGESGVKAKPGLADQRVSEVMKKSAEIEKTP